MSRKAKPPVLKPVFDEESILRFAALGSRQSSAMPLKESPAIDSSGIFLHLTPDVLNLLKSEAGRKGKTIDQVVAKLVTKHLGKQHK